MRMSQPRHHPRTHSLVLPQQLAMIAEPVVWTGVRMVDTIAAERSPSGLWRSPGKRVWCKSHRGFESRSLRHGAGPCDPRFIFFPSGMIIDGRARRGAGGALYPQSAVAGLNSCPRSGVVRSAPDWAAMMVRSCSTVTCEPRQVRKEATVNGAHWVLQGSRAGASRSGKRGLRSGRRQVHGRNLNSYD
jgi:hypothetical protein